ncbi:MAG: HlyD family efflux transporter periplasmic adaptor subunit [Pseudobdellovibrionaceae bacterium]
MTSTPNLVHEADAQRHHVRVKLPANIEIGGVSYEMKDWSTAGASVSVPTGADAAIFADGKVHDARLMFNLEGFFLTVPMTVEMRHAGNEDGGKLVGMRFINMSKEQIVVMQHLVGSYVTGVLSSVDEIIHVLSRNNFTKPRQVPKRDEDVSFGEKLSLTARKMAIPLISIGLLAYVGTAAFEQKFVVAAEKAVVTGEGVSVAAPAGGVVNFKGLHSGDSVKKGDMLMTVLSDGGTITGVDSPCDCVIETRSVEAGETIGKGGIMMRLIPVNAPLHIEAFVGYNDAIRLAKGQSAVIRAPGSQQKFSGVIKGISIKANTGNQARVVIEPAETIPLDMIGVPVGVKINTVAGKSTE